MKRIRNSHYQRLYRQQVVEDRTRWTMMVVGLAVVIGMVSLDRANGKERYETCLFEADASVTQTLRKACARQAQYLPGDHKGGLLP